MFIEINIAGFNRHFQEIYIPGKCNCQSNLKNNASPIPPLNYILIAIRGKCIFNETWQWQQPAADEQLVADKQPAADEQPEADVADEQPAAYQQQFRLKYGK